MMLLEKSLLVIFALLLVATLVNRILVWRRPDKDWRELTLRIRTWWLIIILFSLALLSPTWLALTFFCVTQFYGAKRISDAGSLPVILTECRCYGCSLRSPSIIG
ncbi:transferase [Salmonella enterica subsp. enterica]|nr:transferase [Salmonella enterica subsp. enterica]